MKMKKLIKAVALAVCLTMAAPVVAPSGGIETVEAATKVKLNCTKKSIYEGDSLKLKITGTTKKVKWSSSNKNVATVSSKGSVKGISKGSCKITASVGGKKYTCKVTVKEKNNNIQVSAIELSENQKKMVIGEEFTLSASIIPYNATNQDIVWQSINSNVATVDNGVVKAISAGTTKLYASSNNGVSAVCTITVVRDYMKDFNSLSIYEKAGLFAISKIDKTMKAENKSYKIYRGDIGAFAKSNIITGAYSLYGKAAVKVYYYPSTGFSNGIVPNYIVYISEDNRLYAYGMQGEENAYTTKWSTATELGQNTLSALELYDLFIELQNNGYDVSQLCTE